MNYLFVMPRYRQNEEDTYMFPLGVAYVSASLKVVRKSVYCLNLNVNMGPIEEELREAIEKYQIDVIATGGLTPNYKQIKTIITTAKKIKPNIITMVGGGLLTATPEVIMRGIPDLDIGMIGEGEFVIRELADALEGKQPLEPIRGIVYRRADGAVIRTGEREDIQDLDALPFPDYEGFHFDDKNGISICTSRSCPFNCTFCFHTCGKRYRSRSLDSVFQEIDWLVEKYNVTSLGILDELFSMDIAKMEKFCERIEKYHIKWGCQMRVDNMNVEILQKMKKSGCQSLSFGIESADNRILKSMDKHTTIEKVEQAINMAREAGICPFGNLLLGDKADDLESFQKCLEWYLNHTDIQLGFNKILVLPGSKLYQYAVNEGYITDEVQYLEKEDFAVNITTMSDEEYKSCVRTMDDVVARREYPLKDVKIKGIEPESRRVMLEGTCPLCEEKIDFTSNDCFATQNQVCPQCGRPFTSNLYNERKDILEEQLHQLWRDKVVVIWGMGNEGLKMVHQSNIVMEDNVYLIDRNNNKQIEVRQGKWVLPIEKMNELEADIVLIGTNAPVTNQAVREEIAAHYPKVKVVDNLNDYLFQRIRETINAQKS